MDRESLVYLAKLAEQVRGFVPRVILSALMMMQLSAAASSAIKSLFILPTTHIKPCLFTTSPRLHRLFGRPNASMKWWTT